MDGPPSVDLVVKAVNSLYNGQDPSQKEEAGRWLQEYQNSVYAWTISDQLLQQKRDIETCYFAAQTLRSKIQSKFHELPENVHESLRNSLLEHLNAVTGTTDSVIKTQLCLAMADLVLLMPEWKNAVPELIQRLAESSKILTLLEVLMLLPEEIESRHLRLGENRRKEMKEQLQSSADGLNQLLQTCLSNTTDTTLDIQILVIKCYSSWMTLHLIPLQSLHSSSVIHLAVSALSHHSTPGNMHDAASDCVISVLTRFEKESDPALERTMFDTVVRFEEPYQHAVSEEDMEKCLNYCRIFTELGESFLFHMVTSPPSSPHFTVPILDTVLLCCSHPDYELPDLTFNLWYRLSEELYNRNDDNLIQVFKPYIERLIVCLSRHCQMEPDMVGCLGDDEDFAEFRTRVSDLIKDCAFIVGSSSVFRQMYGQLQQANQWEQTEAALYVMQAVARYILPDEDEVVPAVLQQVLALPHTLHQAVRVTAVRLVGELSEWIEQHPEILQAVLQHLLQGLQDPVLASEAATALQSVCSKCRKQMAQHFSGLVQILEQLDKFNIKPEPAKGLVKGAALIISIMQKDQLESAVVKVCELQVKPLCALMEKQKQEKIVKNSVNDPVLYLDRLADIFRHVTPSNGSVVPSSPHPCKGVVEATWPALSRCCDHYGDNERVTERTCRTIRFAIRCLGIQSACLLQPLVTQLIRLYELHKHSCYLYLGSILVDEFGGESGCIPGLVQMVQAFISPTYSLLAKADGLRNNPGTVDDFFRLNARFMQRAPMSYLQTEFLMSVVECGIMSVSLEHREANTSVMKFFHDLLSAGRTKDKDYEARNHLVVNLHSKFAKPLLETLITSAVLNLPTYTYADIGDVIFEMLQHDRSSVSGFLENALKNLPNTSSTPAVTTKQLVEFHKSVTSAERPIDISQAIREFSRLWR